MGDQERFKDTKGRGGAVLFEEDKKRDSKLKEGRSVVCAWCPW